MQRILALIVSFVLATLPMSTAMAQASREMVAFFKKHFGLK